MQEDDDVEFEQDPVSSVNGLHALMWLPFNEIERCWSEADFQSKLLLLLIGWLIVNIILIRIAWTRFGSRLCDSFLREVHKLPAGSANSKGDVIKNHNIHRD